MKFGLMYEIQIPEPHYPGIVKDTYKQVMAQVVLAEEVCWARRVKVARIYRTKAVDQGSLSPRNST